MVALGFWNFAVEAGFNLGIFEERYWHCSVFIVIENYFYDSFYVSVDRFLYWRDTEYQADILFVKRPSSVGIH